MKKICKWLIPAFFVLLAVFCCLTVHGHSFLGIISGGIAIIICCYYFIYMIRSRNIFLGKLLNTIFTSLLCIGIALFTITEITIIHASKGDNETDFSYLIVLGAKVNGTDPSLSLNDRIQEAYRYLSEHPDVTAVLSGGQGADEGISEALCMYQSLTSMGIAPDRLWMESQATSTLENLQFSLDIIEEKTGSRPEMVGILSSEYHLYRAGLFANACGVQAVGIPAQTTWPTIRLNYYLREVAAVWKYIILGG